MKKIIATALTAITLTANAQIVNGAGATFPAPLYSKWAEAYYKETNIKINYQSIGSGAGIKQIEAKTVAFGASDMPLTDARLKEMNAVQWPLAIGGVVPVVNIKGIESGKLRLTGQALGDIYLGKITKWNDPVIAKLNPDVALPNQPIMVVRRADGSGTTFIWTNYLSKVNDEFKQTIGEGTSVNWKVGAGGKGNEGVSAMVKQLPGSIGYVEYAYVKQAKLNWVSVENSQQQWVTPNDDAFKAAAAGAQWDKSFYQILTNQQGKDSWPITGATFIIMPVNHHKPDEAKLAIDFFKWSLKNGDKMAEELDYVPMPKSLIPRLENEMNKVK